VAACPPARLSGFAFVEGALERADYLRMDPPALRALWPQGRMLWVDGSGQALGDATGPQLDHLPVPPPADAVFLGLHQGHPWFACAPPAGREDAPRLDLRSAAAQWSALHATAFAQARAVLHWRSRQRFCGVCGGTVAFERAGWLGRCPECGTEHYPRTDPAVIAAITDGERLLLGRNVNWAAGLYSTLAGFVEPGETLEQALAREVWEESSVRVRHCQYLASQPWPFPSSLMLGFLAEAEPDLPRPNEELEDVRWFSRAEVVQALANTGSGNGLRLPPRLSISRWLIEAWLAGASSSSSSALRGIASTLHLSQANTPD